MASVSSASGSFNIDGVVSGLNTTDIVNQLIAVEARPQQFTMQRKAGFETESNALSALRTKLATARSGALSLSSSSEWQSLAATTSDDSFVSVTAGSASGIGTLSFSIDSLASSDIWASGWTAAATGDVIVADPGGGAARTITVGAGTDSRTIDVGNGSLEAVVNAINGQVDFKVSAAAVKVGANSYRLQLTASESGAANTVSFTAGQFVGAGSWLHVSAGANAVVTIGSGPGSYTVSSATNILSDVLPGVTMTLKRTTAVGQSVTVASSRSGDAVADKIDKMLTDLNVAINQMNSDTKYDASTKKAGPLLDNSAVRQVRQLLAEAISGSSGTTNAALAGVSINRDGTVQFDRSKFLEAWAKDPTATQALFTDGPAPGVGKRLYDALDRAVNVDSGLLTSSQNSLTQSIAALQTSIDGMQLRLDKRATTLRAQFTAMETALGSLKSQSSWLSGQLAQL